MLKSCHKIKPIRIIRGEGVSTLKGIFFPFYILKLKSDIKLKLSINSNSCKRKENNNKNDEEQEDKRVRSLKNLIEII